jgi:two-component system, cell cycle sensor histidine kinase and response regulator CckA
MNDCRLETAKITVLLVEDNEGDVRLIRRMLRDSPDLAFSIQHADTLSSALDFLARAKWGIILLDLALPDSSGLDTLQAIIHRAPEIPIIVLTGLSDEKVAVEAVRRGAQDYLVKGDIGGRLLIRSICYAIERRQAEDERESLRAQLIHAQKMEALGTLAAGIAHDFNNILTIIKRNIGYARAISDLPPKMAAALDAAEEAGTAGRELVRRLLQFGRPIKAGVQAISLNKQVEETLAFLQAVIPCHIAIEHRLCKDECLITADPSAISLIITNLCINARDAMPRGGSLIIETRRSMITEDFCRGHAEALPGDFCILQVSDTGTGIPPELIERIFEPFFTTKDEEKGTGLGLSMVYSTVRNLGGWIECRSTEGSGTTFILGFPAAICEAAEKGAEKCEAPPVKSLKNAREETILLADDTEILLIFGRKVLEENGFRVLTACDGEAALSVFREKIAQISLVILDAMMPRMDGLRAMAEIKQLSPEMPVIISSSHSNESIAAMAGGKDFEVLPKDYSPAEMVCLIRKMLDSRLVSHNP